jgi:phage shock protein A
MQSIRLWTAALVSRVDGMVSRIENHEALAQSAIREVRQAAARASVQLRRVRRDGERQRQRLDELREAQATWRDRARRKAEEDETTALECLRRSQQAARRAAALQARLRDHERIERQLARDVTAVEERLVRLDEQRHVLVTRQSRAEAMSALRDTSAPLHTDLDDLFDRWEVRIAESELAGGCSEAEDIDPLEGELDREEEQEALRAELEALRRS